MTRNINIRLLTLVLSFVPGVQACKQRAASQLDFNANLGGRVDLSKLPATDRANICTQTLFVLFVGNAEITGRYLLLPDAPELVRERTAEREKWQLHDATEYFEKYIKPSADALKARFSQVEVACQSPEVLARIAEQNKKLGGVFLATVIDGPGIGDSEIQTTTMKFDSDHNWNVGATAGWSFRNGSLTPSGIAGKSADSELNIPMQISDVAKSLFGVALESGFDATQELYLLKGHGAKLMAAGSNDFKDMKTDFQVLNLAALFEKTKIVNPSAADIFLFDTNGPGLERSFANIGLPVYQIEEWCKLRPNVLECIKGSRELESKNSSRQGREDDTTTQGISSLTQSVFSPVMDSYEFYSESQGFSSLIFQIPEIANFKTTFSGSNFPDRGFHVLFQAGKPLVSRTLNESKKEFLDIPNLLLRQRPSELPAFFLFDSCYQTRSRSEFGDQTSQKIFLRQPENIASKYDDRVYFGNQYPTLKEAVSYSVLNPWQMSALILGMWRYGTSRDFRPIMKNYSDEVVEFTRGAIPVLSGKVVTAEEDVLQRRIISQTEYCDLSKSGAACKQVPGGFDMVRIDRVNFWFVKMQALFKRLEGADGVPLTNEDRELLKVPSGLFSTGFGLVLEGVNQPFMRLFPDGGAKYDSISPQTINEIKKAWIEIVSALVKEGKERLTLYVANVNKQTNYTENLLVYGHAFSYYLETVDQAVHALPASAWITPTSFLKKMGGFNEVIMPKIVFNRLKNVVEKEKHLNQINNSKKADMEELNNRISKLSGWIVKNVGDIRRTPIQ